MIKNNINFNRLSLFIGSVFPDIVDKFVLFLKIGSGRGYAHSLLFIIVSFLIVLVITKGNKPITFPFLIGMIIHLLLDFGPYLPLFWPFLYYEFGILEDPIGLWLEILLTNPIIMLTELIGLSFLIFIIVNNKLFSFNSIIKFLGTHNQNTIEKTNN